MDITSLLPLRRAADAMSAYRRTWGIAGGWALDLFLGRETRAHADVDIATLRIDQMALRMHLRDATLQKVVDGMLADWPVGEDLTPPVHEVWATWDDGRQLELLLNEVDSRARDWVFRRDARVRLPLAEAFLHRGTTPYLTPQIVLLYKAKAPGAKDEEDFLRVLPALSDGQKGWLCGALGVVHPGHPWIARAAGSG